MDVWWGCQLADSAVALYAAAAVIMAVGSLYFAWRKSRRSGNSEGCGVQMRCELHDAGMVAVAKSCYRDYSTGRFQLIKGE